MGIFQFYFHVVIYLIYAPYLCKGGTRLIKKPSRDEFSDHWARCEAILKQGETRSCTQSGGPSCTGRRASEPNEDEPGYWCDADSCPTVLSSLSATVYEEDLLVTHPGLWWYGVNISWAINAKGTPQDTEQKTFLIAANIGGFGRTYFAEINVTLEESDYVDGVATLYYDCIYPISDNQSYTLNIDIKSKPHAIRDFKFTTVETMPNVLPTPTSRPTTTTPKNSLHHQGSRRGEYKPGDGTTTETPPETSPKPGIDKQRTEEQLERPESGEDVNPGLVFGLIGGLLGVAVMGVAIFAVRKHWTRRQNSERLQKVAFLTLNDDAMLMKLNKDFLTRLHRSFKCRIVKVQDIPLESVGQPYDIIRDEMTSAFCIIVVTSERLLDVLARLDKSRYDHQETRDPSSMALAIIYRELRSSQTHMSKIVCVQFEGRHTDPTTPCLSPWRCVSHPGSTDKLVRFLKGDRSALEVDEMDTTGDSSELNLDSGVQLSDDQSSISSAAKMASSSWNVPPPWYGQRIYPTAHQHSDPINPCSQIHMQGPTYHKAPDWPNAEQHMMYSSRNACLPSVEGVHNGYLYTGKATNALNGPQTSWRPPVVPHEQSEIGSEAIEDMVHAINSGPC